MESFSTATPLWDLSQASSFSALQDDDFLALLQKQFPTSGITSPGPVFNIDTGAFTDGIDPQSISHFTMPEFTTPSEDNSPSPSSANERHSRRQSSALDGGGGEIEDPLLKRKASDDSMDDGPAQKSNKKNSRRKSTGAQDETRLLKRKEQNRAAQRAFRERKEKHVKDLEDKVAALEAKNEQAQSENENLRDLLSRLQNENIVLKQTSFTFSALPKLGESSTKTSQTSTHSSPMNIFSSSNSHVTSPTSATSPKSSLPSDGMDWSSLTSFDSSVLSLLDESPQTTATAASMGLDFGFGEVSSKTPYTTLATNPMFMSFADFGTPSSSSSNNSNSNNNSVFPGFDIPPWQTSPGDAPDTTSLDEMFGGNFLGAQSLVDFRALSHSPPSTIISPVSHAGNSRQAPASNSPSSSNTSSSAGSPFNRDSPPSESEKILHSPDTCPKSREEAVQRFEAEGTSPFAPPPPGLRKGVDAIQRAVVMCHGTNIPKVEMSDKNVEVLTAWRSITSNPVFKDFDINELCSEFTSKAKCDGTKVVLEPHGVTQILQSLSAKTAEKR